MRQLHVFLFSWLQLVAHATIGPFYLSFVYPPPTGQVRYLSVYNSVIGAVTAVVGCTTAIQFTIDDFNRLTFTDPVFGVLYLSWATGHPANGPFTAFSEASPGQNLDQTFSVQSGCNCLKWTNGSFGNGGQAIFAEVDSGPNFGVLYTLDVASKPSFYHPTDLLVMPVNGPLAQAAGCANTYTPQQPPYPAYWLTVNYGGTTYWMLPDQSGTATDGQIFVSNICQIGSAIVQQQGLGTLWQPFTGSANKYADMTPAGFTAGKIPFKFTGSTPTIGDRNAYFAKDSDGNLQWYDPKFYAGQVQFYFDATPECGSPPYLSIVYTSTVLAAPLVPVSVSMVPNSPVADPAAVATGCNVNTAGAQPAGSTCVFAPITISSTSRSSSRSTSLVIPSMTSSIRLTSSSSSIYIPSSSSSALPSMSSSVKLTSSSSSIQPSSSSPILVPSSSSSSVVPSTSSPAAIGSSSSSSSIQPSSSSLSLVPSSSSSSLGVSSSSSSALPMVSSSSSSIQPSSSSSSGVPSSSSSALPVVSSSSSSVQSSSSSISDIPSTSSSAAATSSSIYSSSSSSSGVPSISSSSSIQPSSSSSSVVPSTSSPAVPTSSSGSSSISPSPSSTPASALSSLIEPSSSSSSLVQPFLGSGTSTISSSGRPSSNSSNSETGDRAPYAAKLYVSSNPERI